MFIGRIDFLYLRAAQLKFKLSFLFTVSLCEEKVRHIRMLFFSVPAFDLLAESTGIHK